VRNYHPTVKPVELMRWLCRLVCPPAGVVVDCFAGSGSTGVACVQEGSNFVGVEQRDDYVAIAEARIRYARVNLAEQAALFD
jgi:site-specific DNA-methyltransferase (adenine-specific)